MSLSFTPAPYSRPAVPNHPSSKPTVERDGADVTLEDLFNYGRIKEESPLWHKVAFLFFYLIPFGLGVFLARLVGFLMLCISVLVLPRWLGDKINITLLQLNCGVFLKHNHKGRLCDEPYIIAGNHLTDWDAMLMWLVMPRFHTLTAAHLKVIPIVGKVYAKLNSIFVSPTPEGRAEVKARVNDIIKNDRHPILIFPEGGLTNGKVGTMMYHRFVFSLDVAIVPLAITLKNPWPVEIDYLGSTWFRNFVWFLLVPFHVFEYHYLPVQKRNEGETAEEFALRVQQLTCDYLRIQPTQHSYGQKKELGKLLAEGKMKRA